MNTSETKQSTVVTQCFKFEGINAQQIGKKIGENQPIENAQQIPKVAAIHDLSGFGRCSLTVIIPILSSMGIQVCPVPTAVLSAHTGFANMVLKDLTDFLTPCYNHYNKLGLSFDAIYSGFLSASAQVDSCLEFFHGFDSLKVVDPVMGDNGKPYKTYTKELCNRMKELAKVADIITPNLTEAAILLDENYTPRLSESTAREWLQRLCEYSTNTIITGVIIDGNSPNTYCNIGMSRECNILIRADYEQIPVHYPGTGDIFASVVTGSLLRGSNLESAIVNATNFAQKSVQITYDFGGEPRNGVMFEKILHELR